MGADDLSPDDDGFGLFDPARLRDELRLDDNGLIDPNKLHPDEWQAGRDYWLKHEGGSWTTSR